MGIVWLNVPALPVMVRVDEPAAAEADTESVKMQLVEDGPVPNDPVTPVGNPETVTVTALLNPFCEINVIVLVPVAPPETLSEVGEADKLNDGGCVMVSVTVVLLVSKPEVPVMVTVALAAAAALVAVKVATLVRVDDMAPKLAVTPAGSPEAASETAALNPFRAATAMELVPLVPGFRFKAAGEAESVKLGGAVMVAAMLV
jgi:hypothetical protein